MSEMRCDFETKSDVDLKVHGSARYFASSHWAALILCYSIDGGPVRTWTYRDRECPADVAAHIRSGGRIRAFNCNFEMQCFEQQANRLGWPLPRVEQYVCTAVEAAAMALPRSLEAVGAALNLPIQKDKTGADLIKFFSIPQRRLKRHAHLPPGPIFNDPEEHPEQFAAFCRYCKTDVETEAAVAARLFPLSTSEQEMYTLDQIINRRGIRADLESVRAAMQMAEKAKAELLAELLSLTGGAVTGVNKSAEMCAWINERMGRAPVPEYAKDLVNEPEPFVTSIAKAVVADLLELDDLPSDVRRVLEIRQQGAKSSTAKLQAFVDRASADGRVRHAFVMNAAGTGRWSSRGVQLHNLPRPRKTFGDAHPDLGTLFKFVRTADPAVVQFMYGPELGQPLPLLADALKSFIWAAPGHDIMEVDYSGIEDGVGMWLAGETWALDAMREIIADPSLPDMYRRTAEGIYGEPIAKSDPRRQTGKVSRLALLYEGGVAALWSMSRVYGLKLHDVFQQVWASADEERRERACKRYERCLKRGEAKTDVLTREGWIAGELVKIGYRATHPAVNDGWGVLRDAMRAAVEEPGTQVKALGVTYLVAHNFLWCRLPSGRCLAYAAPRLRPMVWFKDAITDESECIPAEQGYARERNGEGRVQSQARASVTALGVNSVTLKFERYGLYGGIAMENCVQAIAADLLRHGIKQAERAGYPVVGHIHDAVIAEVPRGFGSVAELSATMCELPPWAAGLPLTAAGYRGKRLRKD